MSGSTIAGLGVALASEQLTNAELGVGLGVTEDWIFSRTGIHSRRVAGPQESATTLGTAAAFAAIADCDVAVDDVDSVICATVTPDYRFPAAACEIQAALGISGPAFDLNAGCSGFLVALAQADALIRAGSAQAVLVVGTDVLSRLTDYHDRGTAILFGDGAGAAIVRRSETGTWLGPFDLFSDGSRPDLLYVDPVTNLIHMKGREVYRAAVEAMSKSIGELIDRCGMSPCDVDLVVAHQANQRILDAVADRVGVPRSLAFSNVAYCGNTSAASMPIALFDARAEGRLKDGDLVVLTAFGAGFTWGAGLLRWRAGDSHVSETRAEETADV